MLEQILDYIHNYFIKERHNGSFTIQDGELNGASDFLLSGQYYKINGSVFNDGVHQLPLNGESSGLTDETFVGEIWAMAVPPTVVALSDEIELWVEKYGQVLNSPYNSESFGGYSYTKSNGGTGSSGNVKPFGWESVFGSRLNHWRKIS